MPRLIAFQAACDTEKMARIVVSAEFNNEHNIVRCTVFCEGPILGHRALVCFDNWSDRGFWGAAKNWTLALPILYLWIQAYLAE